MRGFAPDFGRAQRHMDEYRRQQRQRVIWEHRRSPADGIVQPMTAVQLARVRTGVLRWRLGLPDQLAANMFISQPPGSNWCWAACFAMSFRYFGLQLSPYAIVQIVLGGPQDQRIGAPTIRQHMTREWLDDTGARFQAAIEEYRVSNQNRVQNVDRTIIDQIRTGRLLFIGENDEHITLLRSVEVEYEAMTDTYTVLQATLLDPMRNANTVVQGPQFAAVSYVSAIQITRVQQNAAPQP